MLFVITAVAVAITRKITIMITTPVKEITDFDGDFASIKESFVHILKEFNTP